MNYVAVDGINGAINFNVANATYVAELMIRANEDIHALEPNREDMQKLFSDNATLMNMIRNRPSASIDVVTAISIDALSTLSGLDPFSRFRKLREKLAREGVSQKDATSIIKKHFSTILRESAVIIWDRIRRNPEIQKRARSLGKILTAKRKEIFSWCDSPGCAAMITKHYTNPKIVNFAINPYLRMEYQFFRGFFANILGFFDDKIAELSADLSGFLKESKRTQIDFCEAAKNSLDVSREVRRDSRFFVRRYKTRIREVVTQC